MTDPGRDESMDRLLERALPARSAAGAPDACPDAEMLAAWSAGGLDAGEQARVDAHAAGCARCQAHLAALARMSPEEPSAAPRSSYPLWRWLVPGTAAAAALALWVWVQPARTPGAPESAAALQTEAAAPPTEQPARIAAPPGAAATEEGRRAADSVVAERRREPGAPANQVQAGARGSDARRERALADTAATAAAPAAALRADATVARTLVIVSPDPAVRWRVSGSTIHRSTDAGATWEAQSPGVDAQFTAGVSPRPSVCWLVGRGGIVLVSTDGRTWRRLPFPEAVDLVAVSASSAANASVTAADARVLTTADAGATWLRP